MAPLTIIFLARNGYKDFIKITKWFFCFCLYCHAYGQKKDISGIYISDSSPKIEIKGEELIYTEHSDHLPIWHNDTLAICKIKQVDKHVWEISSLDSFYDIYRTMEIVICQRIL